MNLPEHRPDGSGGQPDHSRLRASDSDRDRVADRLREALAEGRLSAEEHADRIDAVYAAKTYAELTPLTADLPAPPGTPRAEGGVTLAKGADAPAVRRERTSIVAILGGTDRKGRWLVEPHTSVVVVMGGVDLDFREAVLTRREVTVNVMCLMGGVDIKVPPGVRVVNSAVGIMGGVETPDEDALDPEAPVIRITGVALMGGISVKVCEPKAARREQRRLAREQRRARREDRRSGDGTG